MASGGLDVPERILAAIESLEERVSALAAADRQAARPERFPALTAVEAPVLTKPGHADQFKFCEEVRRLASSALVSGQFDETTECWIPVGNGPEAFDVLATALQRVVSAVEARQKLIRLADRSELGWRVVQHYVADPIADDADDEKRIKRATK